MLWLVSLVSAAETPASTEEVAEAPLEVIVYADLRHRPDRETPTSTTVIGAETIERRDATHLEEVLNTAANVNFASGTSRARFYQIRGIGERSQYTEPLNPSVGLMVDGIDLTGLGTVASLVDTRQVEVLKGPQGTLYGANAMAGLIVVDTNEPGEEWGAEATIGLRNYDTLEARGMVNAPLSDAFKLRLATSYLRSDGFIENTHLGRDDTMGRDELTVRGKLAWTIAPEVDATVSAFHGRANNGFDAFNFDNDRTTQADQPGYDDQDTTGASAGLVWRTPVASVEARFAHAFSNSAYGYDEDWTYEGYHPDGYSSFDAYERDIRMSSAEVRLISGEDGDLFGDRTDWVVGLYAYDRKADLTRTYTYLDEDFQSTNRITRVAAYGEATTRFDSPFSVTLGLRGEQNTLRYSDNTGVTGKPSEPLWGGKLAGTYGFRPASVYALVSRGYKSGGFNADPSLPADLQAFRTEALWNGELGLKSSWADGRSRAKAAVFYQARTQVQSNGSLTIVRDDGSTQFIDYTENADRGYNAGVEAEADVELIPQLRAYGSLGLLQTRLFAADPNETYHDREQAMAPSYQGVVGMRAKVGPVFGGTEVEAKDSFYFSPRHDTQSTAYGLVNAHLGVDVGESLTFTVWGRNLNDAKVYTRGFGAFGNDPANGYETQPYLQLGEPRVYGAKITGRI